jgi:hypothetical protein
MGMPRSGTGYPFPAFSQHQQIMQTGRQKRKFPPSRPREQKFAPLTRLARGSPSYGGRRPRYLPVPPFSRETTRVAVTPAWRPSFSSPILCQSIRWPRYQLACLAPPSCVNTVLLRPLDRPRPTMPSRVCCVCDLVQAGTHSWWCFVARGRYRWRVGAARLCVLTPSTTFGLLRFRDADLVPHLQGTHRDIGSLPPSGRASADKTIRPLRHVGLMEVNITQRTERYTTPPSCTVSRPGPPREAACPGSKASC